MKSIACVTTSLAALGLLWAVIALGDQPPARIEAGAPVTAAAQSPECAHPTPEHRVMVGVVGAVPRPGVFFLSAPARPTQQVIPASFAASRDGSELKSAPPYVAVRDVLRSAQGVTRNSTGKARIVRWFGAEAVASTCDDALGVAPRAGAPHTTSRAVQRAHALAPHPSSEVLSNLYVDTIDLYLDMGPALATPLRDGEVLIVDSGPSQSVHLVYLPEWVAQYRLDPAKPATVAEVAELADLNCPGAWAVRLLRLDSAGRTENQEIVLTKDDRSGTALHAHPANPKLRPGDILWLLPLPAGTRPQIEPQPLPAGTDGRRHLLPTPSESLKTQHPERP